MRDRYEDVQSAGARLAAIGMGDIEEATAFADSHPAPFPLLVDPERVSHRVIELSRGSWADVAGPRVWLEGAGATARRGLAVPRQDARQLGGAVVVSRGGELLLTHRSKSSADNLAVDKLLEALP